MRCIVRWVRVREYREVFSVSFNAEWVAIFGECCEKSEKRFSFFFVFPVSLKFFFFVCKTSLN